MLEHFFKSLVATVSDPYQCNRITDALAAAGIKFYCKSKDVNRHNTFDQARIGTLGIKPQYVTEVFVDKENAAEQELSAFLVIAQMMAQKSSVLILQKRK